MHSADLSITSWNVILARRARVPSYAFKPTDEEVARIIRAPSRGGGLTRYQASTAMAPIHYSINGEEPRIIGQACTGFVLLHFCEGTVISNQVLVAHLKFDGQWYRLCFECGMVFWRESHEPPGMPVNSTLEYNLVLNDLSELNSVVGQVVESISYSGNEAGDVEVRLGFATGTAMKFSYSAASDSTCVAA